ncbi:MAG: DUF393 domain-containing protein [Brachymonas sp.]|nr:DUF393 domain-containing protein [Brachymonas sp.]
MPEASPRNDTPDSQGLWPVTLYYDGSCPMCLTEMTNLMLRNTRGLLRFVDAAVPGFNACPPGTTQRDLMTVLHAERADGQLVLGIPAFELAYEGAGIVFVARALRAPIIKPFMVWLYPWVARNRQHLPAWLAYAVFGGAMRRAAARAAQQQCGSDRVCALPTVGNYTPASPQNPDGVNRQMLAHTTPWMTLHADELRRPARPDGTAASCLSIQHDER